MGLRIIYGRSGSGKTKVCLDEIKAKVKEGDISIFIVPEQFSFQAEKELVRNSYNGGILKSEVLSFGRLCYRIFNEEGGITYPHIHQAGKSMIIQNIIDSNSDKFEVFNKIYNKHGFIEVISKLITEFKRYDVSVLDLKNVLDSLNDDELRQKLSEICLIYDEFENSIYKKYTDCDDELTMAAKRLRYSNMFCDTNIWIDGFSGYTKQEYNMIEVLLKKAKTVSITFCLDNICDNEEISEVDTFSQVKWSYRKIVDIAKKNDIAIEQVVNLDHIYKFDNNPELCHLEKNYAAYPYDLYYGKTNSVSINLYNDIFDEIQDVAKKITMLCQEKDYRYRDIAIVTRDIKLYQKMLEVILKEYDIPYFIDKKFEMSNNNLVRFIISVMEIFTENWSYETVFNAVKTGFFNIDEERIERLENYVLACGIKGSSKWTNENPWNMMPYFMPNKTEENNIEILEEINDTRDCIVKPLMNFRSKNNEKKTAMEFCKDLYDLLCELNIPNQIEKIVDWFNKEGNLDRASEYGQVWNVFMDFLDQIVEVCENEKMSIRKFLGILKTGIKEYNLGIIPMGQDQVLVGSVERSKSHNIKVMYILGVNDGIFPAKGLNEGILSDKDRHILEKNNVVIAKDTKSKMFDEQFLIYQTLTVPSEILHISYSMKDFSGKALRPSIIISRLKKIFPNITFVSNINKSENGDDFVSKAGIFNELIKELKNKLYKKEYNKEWDSVYKWFLNDELFSAKCEYIKNAFSYDNKEENLSKKRVHALYGDTLTQSVSRLEKFTACPFGFYVQYGLKVKERKIYKLTPPDIGTFLHAVIDVFSKEVSGGENTWRTFDIDWCQNRVSAIIDDMLEKMKGQVIVSSKRYLTLIKRLKRVVTKTIWLIAKQIRDSSFNPLGYEVGFGDNEKYKAIEINLDTGEKIKLIGRIDRVDKFEYEGNTYIRIIDYKSGSKKFKLEDLFYGLQIQLMTYLDAIWETNEKVLPAGMLYFKLEDPIIKEDSNLSDDEIENKILKKLKMNGLVLKDKDIIKGMDNNINGVSLYIPASIRKDGEIGDKTSGVNNKEFVILREYTKKLLKDLCSEIANGKVEISPYKAKDKMACDYCKFLPICQFDKDKNHFRILGNKSDATVLKMISQK